MEGGAGDRRGAVREEGGGERVERVEKSAVHVKERDLVRVGATGGKKSAVAIG